MNPYPLHWLLRLFVGPMIAATILVGGACEGSASLTLLADSARLEVHDLSTQGPWTVTVDGAPQPLPAGGVLVLDPWAPTGHVVEGVSINGDVVTWVAVVASGQSVELALVDGPPAAIIEVP